MAGTYKGLNQAQIDKRQKEGRGQGSDYKPFISGTSRPWAARIVCWAAGPSAIFLTLDWSPQVTDIREQFPMRVEDTVRIAEKHGLPHGRYQGTAQVLTSDFLVDFDDPQKTTIAIQAKYSADLQKTATQPRSGTPIILIATCCASRTNTGARTA